MSRTGPEVASICARGLSKGKRAVTDDEFRDVCASALRQHEQTATYTELKRKAAALKRKFRKEIGDVPMDVDMRDGVYDRVCGMLDTLVVMTKPIPTGGKS